LVHLRQRVVDTVVLGRLLATATLVVLAAAATTRRARVALVFLGRAITVLRAELPLVLRLAAAAALVLRLLRLLAVRVHSHPLQELLLLALAGVAVVETAVQGKNFPARVVLAAAETLAS
jgi:hypothetical protein